MLELLGIPCANVLYIRLPRRRVWGNSVLGAVQLDEIVNDRKMQYREG